MYATVGIVCFSQGLCVSVIPDLRLSEQMIQRCCGKVGSGRKKWHSEMLVVAAILACQVFCRVPFVLGDTAARLHITAEEVLMSTLAWIS